MGYEDIHDPVVPRYEKPQFSPFGPRRFKVGQEGEIEPCGEGKCRQQIEVSSDSGEPLPPLIITGRKTTLEKIRSRIKFVADAEASAERNYRIGYRGKALTARQLTSRERERLELDHGIVLPEHEWSFPLVIDEPYFQDRLF